MSELEIFDLVCSRSFRVIGGDLDDSPGSHVEGHPSSSFAEDRHHIWNLDPPCRHTVVVFPEDLSSRLRTYTVQPTLGSDRMRLLDRDGAEFLQTGWSQEQLEEGGPLRQISPHRGDRPQRSFETDERLFHVGERVVCPLLNERVHPNSLHDLPGVVPDVVTQLLFSLSTPLL